MWPFCYYKKKLSYAKKNECLDRCSRWTDLREKYKVNRCTSLMKTKIKYEAEELSLSLMTRKRVILI